MDLSGSGRFKSFLFDKQSNLLKVGSSSELHLIVEFIDKCALHLENNLPNYKFTCLYKEDPAASSFGNLEKLISIGLCSCTNLESFSRSICSLQCLKKLTLEGSIPEVFKDVHQLQCLEELSFSENEIEINLPDSVCMLKQLKSLKLKYCLNLKKLPDDISQLESLQELCLSHAKIKHLPDGFCMLKQLKSLKLEYCRDLEKLPKEFGQLESLQELCLSGAKIKHLPDGLCMLKQLKSLILVGCVNLEKLPKEFGQLESLQELYLSSAKIKHLPDGLCMLKQLKSLKLHSCPGVERLPEDFGKLESLEKLMLSSTGISRHPDSICMLKYLKCLQIGWLRPDQKLLEDLGRLQCLEKLILWHCQFSGGFPKSIFELKRLKYFHLLRCPLYDLPEELGHLKCLVELDIRGTDISHLPQSIFQLKGLRIIGSKTTLELFGLTPVKRTSDIGDYETFCYTVV